MAERGPSGRFVALAGLGAFALFWLALVAALALRSTESWTPVEPALAQRLLDLTQDQRRLAREWETAQRGDSRFELDTEIRYLAARIEELEARAGHPARVRDLTPWRHLGPSVPTLLLDIARTLAETAASLALALAVVSALGRLRPRPRFVAFAVVLAPLGLPPPMFAHAAAGLGELLGLSPAPALAAVAAILAGLPLAVIPLAWACRRLPNGEIEAARDLGLARATIARRIVLPALAPALGLAGAIVFARLFGDLSIGRIVGATQAADRFGEWTRWRIVAAIDFPTAAAGAVVALAATATIAAGLAVTARWLAPHARGRCTAAPAAVPGPRRPILAVLVVAVPLALLVALAHAALTGAWPALATDRRLAEMLAEGGRAILATGLALALAAILVGALDRSGLRRRAAPVLVAAALSPPATAFALRLLAGDLDLPVGSWVAVGAQALTALAPVTALALAALPPPRADALGPSLRIALRDVMPLALVTAVANAAAVADLGTVVGVVDRTLLLRAPPPGLADPAALLALIAAVAVGVFGAWALETTRRCGFSTRSR